MHLPREEWITGEVTPPVWTILRFGVGGGEDVRPGEVLWVGILSEFLVLSVEVNGRRDVGVTFIFKFSFIPRVKGCLLCRSVVFGSYPDVGAG